LRSLDAFGRHLGTAFQMADDLRDLEGPATGKDRFSDLRSKTPSSVLVLAMSLSPALRERVERAWAEPSPAEPLIASIGAEVLAGGAVGAALSLVDREIELGQAAARQAMSRAGSADLVRFGEGLLQGLR
jgi:octaprenyl-diphosphate synthase